MTAAGIRKARLEDYPALTSLLREADELHARLLPSYFRVPRGPARSRDDMDRLLRAMDEAIYVAEVDGAIVGLVHVQLYDTPAVAVMVPKRRAHIDNLVVAEGARRAGVGRKLVDTAAEWAREKGAREILLTVWAGNEGAEQFYDALGFRRVSSVLGRELD